MARDRAGYPRPYTRNDVLRDRFYADQEMMTHVAAFTLDGRAFGEFPVRVRGPSPHIGMGARIARRGGHDVSHLSGRDVENRPA